MSLLPWEGKEGETLASLGSPTDNGHPEPAVTVGGGDGGMRNGCQFALLASPPRTAPVIPKTTSPR